MSLSEKEVERIAEIAVTVRNATYFAIEAGYTVHCADNVLVASSGKFQGNPWYAPYYWDCVLTGTGTDIDADVLMTRLKPTPAERYAFNIPDNVVSVLLWESDSGFIYLELETKGERE